MAIEQVAVRFVADIQQYAKNVQEAQKYVKNFATTNESAASKIAADLKRMAASYLGLAASVRTVQKIIKEGMDFNKFVETSTAAFGVMMKSTDAAKMKMQELYDWAVKSPLTFKETVAASKQLLAYGFSAGSLVSTMETLGTVSKATGHSLDDIAYVYGTLKTQGRAYTRDLMQFAMRGIPIYDELAKVLGRPKEEIQKLTEAGKVGFAQVEQAFKNMTTNGGVYAGFLQEYMKTLEGKISMLTDVWQKLTGKLTSGIFDAMKVSVDKLLSVLSSSGMNVYIEELGKDIGSIFSILSNLTMQLIKLLPILTQFFKIWLLTQPLLLVRKLLVDLPLLFFNISDKLLKVNAALTIGIGNTAYMSAIRMSIQSIAASIAVLDTSVKALGLSLGGLAALAGGLALVGGALKLISDSLPSTKAMQGGGEAAKVLLAQQTKGIDYSKISAPFKTSTETQVRAIQGLAKAYHLSDIEVADILLKNKSITKEVAEQAGWSEKIMAYKDKYFGSIISSTAQLAQRLADTVGVDVSKITGLTDTGEFVIYGRTAANYLIKGYEDTINQHKQGLAELYDDAQAKKDAQKIVDDLTDVLLQGATVPGFDNALRETIKKYQAIVDSFKKGKEDKPTEDKPTSVKDLFFNADWNLKGTYSQKSIGMYQNQLQQQKVSYEKEKYNILTKELSIEDRNAALLQLQLWNVQQIAAIDLAHIQKKQEWQNETAQINQSITDNEIEGIQLTYDIAIQAAKDKLAADKDFADEYDAYVRALTAKRDKDLNLATYKNVIGGSSKIWEDLQAKAGEQFGYGNWMKGYGISALVGLQGTGVGRLVEGYMGRKEGAGGGAGMGTGLNVFMTALQAAGGVLSMVAKFIVDIVKQSKPMTDLLDAITTSVSGALMPVINSLAEGLAWLYDKVVVPVGNGIIDMVNALIRGINNTFGKWFNFKINEMDALKTTTEALQEMADAAASTEALTQTIDYLQEKLDDMVSSQIESLQDLYEVGAISAQEYETQSKAIYKQYETDKKLVSVADQQLATLGGIYSRLSELLIVQQIIEDESLSNSDTMALLKSMNIASSGATATISQSLYDTLNKFGIDMGKYTATPTTSAVTYAALSAAISSKFHSLGGFASGTNYVPQNMPANIHKGEMIIPSDFSSAIRRGDLTLGSGSSVGGNINVTVNVEGSVQTENKLAASIANAIYRQRRSGVLTV